MDIPHSPLGLLLECYIAFPFHNAALPIKMSPLLEQKLASNAIPRKSTHVPETATLSSALRTSQRLLLHRLLKHLQGQRRLVVRHLVPGTKNPQEAEVVHGFESAALGAVDRVGRQRCGCEGGSAGVGDGVGGGEAAEPVADPVGVAGPHDDADAALDDGGQGGEEVAGVVAGGGEFVVGCVGALGVCCFGTDGAGDGGLEQVAGVGGWWVWVVTRFPDVVDIEVVQCNTAVG